MAPFKVIGVDILPDGNPGFSDVIVLRQMTCELTSLIGIQDLRFSYFEGLFQGVDHHSCIKSIIYFPADNTAAVPVDHGCQIQEPSPDGNHR